MVENEEDGIFCAECNVKMKLGVIPKYDYEGGYTLHNVKAYKCQKCNNIFFTEEQAHEMEARTSELKEHEFGFERKIAVSGKSLIVGIPVELVDHLHIKKGQKVKIVPIAKEGFMIRKTN